MSAIIEAVIDVFEKQIQALYTNDFEKFLSFMTPRIQKELTIDIFQKAIDLYKRSPIDINAINRENSKLYNEGESEEIPDKHVKLVLVESGRTLCHVVEIKGMWLIDDIYWRTIDLEVEDTPIIEDVKTLEVEVTSETEPEPEIEEDVQLPIEDNDDSTEETNLEEEMKISEEYTVDEAPGDEEETVDEEHL